VLEIIGVKDVMNLLVALKPKYLEIYRVTRKVPELYGYEIAYDKERIRSIITSYGKNMIQFTVQSLLCSIVFERCQGFTLTFCLQSGHLKTSFENFKLHVA
jgi:hypothetical protein